MARDLRTWCEDDSFGNVTFSFVAKCNRKTAEQNRGDFTAGFGRLCPIPGPPFPKHSGVPVQWGRRMLLTHFRMHMDVPDRHADALSMLISTFGPDSGIVEDLERYSI